MNTINTTENDNFKEKAEGTYSGRYFEPEMDIYETPEALIMEAELPGIREQDVDIDLHDNELTIMAKWQPVEREGNYLRQEFICGNYIRKFVIPDRLDQSRISATLKNGVLYLTLPKQEKAAPRKITIMNG